MEQARLPDRARGHRHDREFELLVSAINDYAIFLLSPEGHVRTWNKGAERIKGYAAEEIIGEHFSRFYPAHDRETRRPDDELRVAAREGRYEEEGWRIRKDGSRFWANVVITAIRDQHGELIGFGKVTRDLTARRLNEEQLRLTIAELREANQQLLGFRHMVSSVRDYAIFMLDPGGYVTTWNTGARNLKGYREDEIVGRHFSTFYGPEDRLRGHPAEELEIASREGRYEEEGWRVRKDGTRFWASVTITAMRNDHGVLVGFAKVTRDLTARRAAEEELRRTQEQLRRSNADLERYAAVAAHDLREPLASVAGFAGVLRDAEGDRLSDDGRQLLQHITGSVSRMQSLVEDLLRYARFQDSVVPEPVGLATAVERVLVALRGQITERGAAVEIDVAPHAQVLADRSGVDVLLQNLISNALKFGDRGSPRIVVAARRHGAGWRVDVTDNGAGIEPADQERIFKAFERLPGSGVAPGTGLGLAICARVVERSGGQLGVDSEPGGGSTFWFVLQAA